MFSFHHIMMVLIPSILGFIITYKFNYIQDSDCKTARLQELYMVNYPDDSINIGKICRK